MKRIFLLAAISFALVTSSNAQTKGNRGNSPKQEQWQKGGNQSQLEDLNLTQDQKDQMKKLSQDNQAQRKAIMDDNSLTKDQKMTKMKELRDSRQEQMAKILTPDQMAKMKTTRYDSNKRMGRKGNADKSKKMMQDSKSKMKENSSLNLSQDQKDKMTAIRQESKTERDAIANNNSLTKEQKSEKLKELNQNTRNQMSSVLTPAQKEQLQQSKGNRQFRPNMKEKNS